MSQKIKAKLILEKRSQGMTMSEIVKSVQASKQSVSLVCRKAMEHSVTIESIKGMSEDEVYMLLFPEKRASNNLFAPVDYEWVTEELKKVGST